MPKFAIKSPGCDRTDLNYLQECKLALEPAFEALATRAVKAGWSRQETIYALMMIAANALRQGVSDVHRPESSQ